MLHHAYYWKERAPDVGPNPPPGPVQLYVKAWGRPGDAAVIALEDGFPVGAAWFRLFRGVGAGLRLRRRAHAGARDRGRAERARQGRRRQAARRAARSARASEGFEAISLSVDRRNSGAIALYQQHGFEQVGESEDSLTLRATLASSNIDPAPDERHRHGS